MSSSRSIAAARNKRAGDPPPTSRPNTSISSSSVFTNQNAPQTKNSKLQPTQNNQKEPSSNMPFTKISISDAIGLITLRLGKIEQYIIDSENNNPQNNYQQQLPENTQLVDNSVLNSIVSRVDSLEKKEISLVSKISTDLSALKIEMLETVNKFTDETNQKISDIDEAFLSIEESIQKLQPSLLEKDDEYAGENMNTSIILDSETKKVEDVISESQTNKQENTNI